MHVWVNDLIGDTFMQLPGLEALKEQDRLHSVSFPEGSLSDIVLTAAGYQNAGRKEEDCIKFSCGEAMAYGIRNNRHMIEGFKSIMGVAENGFTYPTLDFSSFPFLKAYPWLNNLPYNVIFARHSTSCTGRDPKIGKPNKCYPDSFWLELKAYFDKRGYETIAIGSGNDISEFGEWKGSQIYGEHLGSLMKAFAEMRHPPLVISVDTGIKFLTSACGLKTFTISSALPSWLIGIEKSGVGYDMDIPIHRISSDIVIQEMITKGFIENTPEIQLP